MSEFFKSISFSLVRNFKLNLVQFRYTFTYSGKENIVMVFFIIISCRGRGRQRCGFWELFPKWKGIYQFTPRPAVSNTAYDKRTLQTNSLSYISKSFQCMRFIHVFFYNYPARSQLLTVFFQRNILATLFSKVLPDIISDESSRVGCSSEIYVACENTAYGRRKRRQRSSARPPSAQPRQQSAQLP